jgi:hypothetical protein
MPLDRILSAILQVQDEKAIFFRHICLYNIIMTAARNLPQVGSFQVPDKGTRSWTS